MMCVAIDMVWPIVCYFTASQQPGGEGRGGERRGSVANAPHITTLPASGKMVNYLGSRGVAGGEERGLEDEIQEGRFKGGLSEDDSIWDAWQVRNTPQHCRWQHRAVSKAGQI